VSTLINKLKQVYDINISHSDAPVAGWPADFVLVFGAVNVNETVARVGVVLIQAIEPQDARHHQVLSRRKLIAGFQRHATLENSIARQAAADLLCDTEVADWCFHAAFLSPDSKSRSRHRVGADWRLVFHQREALIADRDVNVFHFWLNTCAELRIKLNSQPPAKSLRTRDLHQIGPAIESGC
jgi:hypothetical protein